MTDFFDRKVRFVPSGSVPSRETVLSQQLRAAHRLETAPKTLSDSASVSVCFLLGICCGFLEADSCCFRIIAPSKDLAYEKRRQQSGKAGLCCFTNATETSGVVQKTKLARCRRSIAGGSLRYPNNTRHCRQSGLPSRPAEPRTRHSPCCGCRLAAQPSFSCQHRQPPSPNTENHSPPRQNHQPEKTHQPHPTGKHPRYSRHTDETGLETPSIIHIRCITQIISIPSLRSAPTPAAAWRCCWAGQQKCDSQAPISHLRKGTGYDGGLLVSRFRHLKACR